jgi:NADP-dependent 3-hydroxy acid dehydrogenase YdfG
MGTSDGICIIRTMLRATETIDQFDYEPQSLVGRRAVITGGTTGIGRAIALQLAADGCRVLISGRHEKPMREALADLHQVSEEAYGVIADMAEKAGVAKMFREADKVLSGCDILIANAGLSAEETAKMDYDAIDYVIRTNVTGYLACCHEAIPRMKRKKSGHIVLIGSMSAVSRGGSSVYTASKTAIQGYGQALGKELAELGIKVSLIEPGAVGADMQPGGSSKHRKKAEKKEMLKAEDIAAMVRHCLIQPPRCDIVRVDIRPHLQGI